MFGNPVNGCFNGRTKLPEISGKYLFRIFVVEKKAGDPVEGVPHHRKGKQGVPCFLPDGFPHLGSGGVGWKKLGSPPFSTCREKASLAMRPPVIFKKELP
jgi:hypothetical protein